MSSQTDQIREALMRGEELTPIEALRRFGCLRLAARVSDLRRDGLQIESATVEANGKRFALYRLESPQRSLL